jgi:hypothetical protein
MEGRAGEEQLFFITVVADGDFSEGDRTAST